MGAHEQDGGSSLWSRTIEMTFLPVSRPTYIQGKAQEHGDQKAEISVEIEKVTGLG